EARKRLAVLAVADEAEARGRRNCAGDAAHTTTMASQRDVCHLVFSIGCELRKVLCKGPFGVGHTFGLRAKKVADWRLDRRHQRRRGRSPKKYSPLDMKLRIARQSAMANAMMSSSLWRRVP